MSHSCPLCKTTQPLFFHEDKRRCYFQCSKCQLVFADPDSWPAAKDEKSEYDLHENHVDDEGYNRFLNRMTEALNQRLKPQSEILDFGCGPAPALAQQLKKHTHQVDLFDIFYFPDSSYLDKKYSSIVMTEVIEHLHNPADVLTTLWKQLHSEGHLAIMTQRVINQTRFAHWTYKNDPTHVAFYSEATFHWLTKTLGGSQLEFIDRDIVIITK